METEKVAREILEFSHRDQVIPRYMVDSLAAYVADHRPVGDFLTAVLSNNLRDAVMTADEVNADKLSVYISYLYCLAPSQCWGSPEKVTEWCSYVRE